MNEIRDEFVERNEDKTAQMQPRVRQRQKLCVELFVSHQEHVEVNGARPHGNVASAAEAIFNAQKTGEQLFWRGKRRAAELGDEVEKRGLVLVFNRRSLVDARETKDVQTSVEHSAHGQQQVAGAVAEIGPHADVSVLNHICT